MREPTTDRLIEALALQARAVKPLLPPALRAAAWLALVAACFAFIIVLGGAGAEMASRLPDQIYLLELVATVVTGAAAIVAAAPLSIPGRSPRWLLLPLPSALVWFGCASWRCYRHVEAYGLDLSPFQSVHCFMFITGASVPLAIAAFFFLRRALPMNSGRVTALAGLGVAALAAVLLQFFHPAETTPVDFATHLAAIALIVVVMTTLGRRALEREA